MQNSTETKATDEQAIAMMTLFKRYGMDLEEAAAMAASLWSSEAMNEMLDIMEAGDFKQPISEIRTAVGKIWKRRQQKT